MTETFVHAEYFNGKDGRVIIEHGLFGTQEFTCKPIKLINDEYRIGVRVNNSEVYVDRRNIILCSMNKSKFAIADKTVKLTLIVNKL